jgi:hypothetical protein
MAAFLRKYGVATTITIPMVVVGSNRFAASADWTPATGDVKLTKDEADVANITTLPTAIGGTGSVLWKFALSAAELQAARITAQVVDAAAKAVEDQAFIVETYGNPSAQHNLEDMAVTVFKGTVDDANHTPTTTEFEADDITEANADQFVGRVVLWRTGVLTGQQAEITDYSLVTGRGHFTVAAMTDAPADGDTFHIV